MRRSVVGASLIVLAAFASFGTLGVFSKLFYRHGGEAFTLLFFRLVATPPFLLVLVGLRRERLPGVGLTVVGLAMGVLQFGLSIALFEAYAHAPVALVALVYYVQPLLVTIGAVLVLHEGFGRRRALVLATAMTGIALVVGAPASSALVGIVLALAAAVCAAAIVLSSRYLLASQRVSPLVVPLLMFSGAAAAVSPLASVRGLDLDLSPAAWAAASGAVLLGIVLPLPLFFAGLRVLDAGRVAILGSAEPLSAVVLAYAVLGESLTLVRLVGGALIVGAVTALSLERGGARRV